MNGAQRRIVMVGLTVATLPLWVLLGATAAAALAVVLAWTAVAAAVFHGVDQPRDPWAAT